MLSTTRRNILWVLALVVALVAVGVAYGVSRNTRGRWSNADVAFLGYAPQDDSEAFAPEILAKNEPENPIAAQFHGGFHCPIGFVGDPGRID